MRLSWRRLANVTQIRLIRLECHVKERVESTQRGCGFLVMSSGKQHLKAENHASPAQIASFEDVKDNVHGRDDLA